MHGLVDTKIRVATEEIVETKIKVGEPQERCRNEDGARKSRKAFASDEEPTWHAALPPSPHFNLHKTKHV